MSEEQDHPSCSNATPDIPISATSTVSPEQGNGEPMDITNTDAPMKVEPEQDREPEPEPEPEFEQSSEEKVDGTNTQTESEQESDREAEEKTEPKPEPEPQPEPEPEPQPAELKTRRSSRSIKPVKNLGMIQLDDKDVNAIAQLDRRSKENLSKVYKRMRKDEEEEQAHPEPSIRNKTKTRKVHPEPSIRNKTKTRKRKLSLGDDNVSMSTSTSILTSLVKVDLDFAGSDNHHEITLKALVPNRIIEGLKVHDKLSPEEQEELTENLYRLEMFQEKHGHCEVPQSSHKLHRWTQQIKSSLEDIAIGENPVIKLDCARIYELEGIGFPSPEGFSYDDIIRSIAQSTSTSTPTSTPTVLVARKVDDGAKITKGIKKEKERKKPHKAALDEKFTTNLQRLDEFKKKHGDFDVKDKYLRSWFLSIKKSLGQLMSGDRPKHAVSSERIQWMEDMGFPFPEGFFENEFVKSILNESNSSEGISEGTSDTGAIALSAGNDNEKNGEISESPVTSHIAKDTNSKQKTRKLKRRMTSSGELGQFNEYLSKLEQFQKKRGTFKIPMTSREHSKLYHWTNDLNKSLNDFMKNTNGKIEITNERIQGLKRIGFPFPEGFDQWRDRNGDVVAATTTPAKFDNETKNNVKQSLFASPIANSASKTINFDERIRNYEEEKKMNGEIRDHSMKRWIGNTKYALKQIMDGKKRKNNTFTRERIVRLQNVGFPFPEGFRCNENGEIITKQSDLNNDDASGVGTTTENNRKDATTRKAGEKILCKIIEGPTNGKKRGGKEKSDDVPDPKKKKPSKVSNPKKSERTSNDAYYDMYEGPDFSKMKALPEAPCLPKFPNTGKCEWTFDEETRVLLAKFNFDSDRPKMTDEDETFLLSMMERTDIAVVSEGLFDGMDRSIWDLEFMDARAGDKKFHRFRLFQSASMTKHEINAQRFGLSRKEAEIAAENSTSTDASPPQHFPQYNEQDGDFSMTIGEYIQYLKKWQRVQRGEEDDVRFIHELPNGFDKEFDVRKESIYLVDCELKKMFPETFDDFCEHFVAKGILPGGKHCMMNAVNQDGRPFMGPNLYTTPPGAFTHFHQDGHGTVDSGHLCIRGFNEVVMLTNMNESHKKHALHLLTCDDRRKGKKLNFDALYGLPHHDGEKPLWPDCYAINKCREYNYYPCVFILKPNQHLHINKGRLHAFRKMSRNDLEPTDCHAKLRRRLVIDNNIKFDDLCISVAWDWMFLGASCDGMKDEISRTLECVDLAQIHGRQSLAIPQLSLIELAKFHLAKYHSSLAQKAGSASRSLEVLKGIFPGLCQVLKKEIEAFNPEYKGVNKLDEFETVTVHRTPDSQQNPQHMTVDPFGNDYFCMLCHRELGNVYLHCDGCEAILQKDFNICTSCHASKERRNTNFLMHPGTELGKGTGRRTDFNHMPLRTRHVKACGCKYGPQCRKCKYMVCCSCKCHKKYTLRTRFYDDKYMKKLLEDVGRCIPSNDEEESLKLPHQSKLALENTNAHDMSQENNHVDSKCNDDKAELSEKEPHGISSSQETPTAPEVNKLRESISEGQATEIDHEVSRAAISSGKSNGDEVDLDVHNISEGCGATASLQQDLSVPEGEAMKESISEGGATDGKNADCTGEIDTSYSSVQITDASELDATRKSVTETAISDVENDHGTAEAVTNELDAGLHGSTGFEQILNASEIDATEVSETEGEPNIKSGMNHCVGLDGKCNDEKSAVEQKETGLNIQIINDENDDISSSQHISTQTEGKAAAHFVSEAKPKEVSHGFSRTATSSAGCNKGIADLNAENLGERPDDKSDSQQIPNKAEGHATGESVLEGRAAEASHGLCYATASETTCTDGAGKADEVANEEEMSVDSKENGLSNKTPWSKMNEEDGTLKEAPKHVTEFNGSQQTPSAVSPQKIVDKTKASIVLCDHDGEGIDKSKTELHAVKAQNEASGSIALSALQSCGTDSSCQSTPQSMILEQVESSWV